MTPSIPYFDFHCDTAFELYKKGERLYDAKGQLSLENASVYMPYAQVFAVWTDNKIPFSIAYDNFFKIKDYLNIQLAENNIPLIKYKEDLDRQNGISALLAVEGADLLDGQLNRLKELYKSGARILTLMWRDSNLCGGAWNTSEGLTHFGKDVVKLCGQLSITVDVSHMSQRSFWDTAELSKAPFIASHSNSKAVFGHDRNLTDEQFCHIRDISGIVGISLCAHHVSDKPDIMDIIGHIEHYLSLSGEDTVCIGCDLDGTENLPEGISGVPDIQKIAQLLRENGMHEELIHKIFYVNAYNFIKNNLPKM